MQTVADQVHGLGGMQQRQGAVYRRALVSDHRHVLTAKKVSVTLHAVAHAAPQQLFFAGHPQSVPGRSGGHHQGRGVDGLCPFGLDGKALAAGADVEDVLVKKNGPETGGLLSAAAQHLLAGDVENAAEILDVRLVGAALVLLADNQNGHFLAGGMNGGLQPGRPGSQDHHIIVFGSRHRDLLWIAEEYRS